MLDLQEIQVVSSEGDINKWNRQEIINSLQKEATSLSDSTIQSIADEIEKQVLDIETPRVTTTHIRELINLELLRRGYSKAEKDYSPLSITPYELESLFFLPWKENSNQTKNPESINLTIAEKIIKQYALNYVFSKEVAEAHIKGDIHLHDLGMCPRPYCSGHSVEYIKKYGLEFNSITSKSNSAKHAEVLVAHLIKASSIFQGNFAGAVGWEAVNVFFAPLLRNASYHEIKQVAQMLIFEFNQLAGARGDQVVFSDINLYLGVPERYRNTPVIAEGGKYLARNKYGMRLYLDDSKDIKEYDEYELVCYGDEKIEETSNLFLRALCEVYLEGDATGKTFFFPKPLIHISKEVFDNSKNKELLDLICKVASKQGIIYFVFDREGESTISQCCRLNIKMNEEEKALAQTPEKIRFVALQNITINLPRIAYEAKGDMNKFREILKKRVTLVAEAHKQKAAFIRKLLRTGKNGVLNVFLEEKDGRPYLELKGARYLCGLIGLNECIQYMFGEQLHESKKAYEEGLGIVAEMAGLCDVIGSRYGIKMILEETPAESAGERLVNLDLKYYPEETKKVAKGTDVKYYTNSVHFAEDAPISFVEKIQKQSNFHPFIQAGSIIHVWLGEHEPSPEVIKKVVKNTLEKTDCTQLCFSPEFTICEDCHTVTRGLKKKCEKCKSTNVYGVTRIVGYFSKVNLWNKGKLAELKDRRRTALDKD